MTDQSDDMRENGSPWSQRYESSKPSENRPANQLPSTPPPTASPAASPSEPSTPPMQPTDVVTGSMTTAWPTVLGILAIVFGGFGVLGGVWGVVAPLEPFMGDQQNRLGQVE